MGQQDGSFIFRASLVIAHRRWPRFIFDFMSVAQNSSGMSNDLSHLYLLTGAKLLAEDPRPDSDTGTPQHPSDAGIPPEADRNYEVSGAGGTSPTLSLAAEVPAGLTSESTAGCRIKTHLRPLTGPGGHPG